VASRLLLLHHIERMLSQQRIEVSIYTKLRPHACIHSTITPRQLKAQLCKCLLHMGVHTRAMSQQLPRMLDTYVSQPDIVLVGWDNELNLCVDIQHRCGRFLAPCMSYLVGFEPGGVVAWAATPSGDALLRRPIRVHTCCSSPFPLIRLGPALSS
jgi:hypothetical protein